MCYTVQAIAFVSALFSNPALRNVTKPDSDRPKVCLLLSHISSDRLCVLLLLEASATAAAGQQ
jgi:hypothetical protein